MGKYKLYEEEHTQHVFTGTDIRECAAKAGFTVRMLYRRTLTRPLIFKGQGLLCFTVQLRMV